MLLLDFIITQMFNNRHSKVKKEDVVSLVKSINGVIEVFKQVSDNIEESRNRYAVKVLSSPDDTFN